MARHTVQSLPDCRLPVERSQNTMSDAVVLFMGESSEERIASAISSLVQRSSRFFVEKLGIADLVVQSLAVDDD